MTVPHLSFEVSPYRLSGVVYSALLNHAPELAALGDAVNYPPYKAPPGEPVLAVKPRNTLATDGDNVTVPAGVEALQMGANLGIVIGRCASRVPAASAMDYVAGYTVVNDISVPVPSHYRPSVRLKARDGFCPMGPNVVPAAQVPYPDMLAVRVSINGKLVHTTNTADRVRGVAQLIADVTEFMTLMPGDVLMLGLSAGAPLGSAGQTVSIEIESIGTLHNQLVNEEVSV